MVSKIVFIDSGFGDGATQMQLDETLAREFLSTTLQPLMFKDAVLVRLYGWSPPAISLGFNQKETDIDKAKLSTDGFQLVRRPTGGRAVFHVDEITYAVICRASKSNAEHYAEINIALKTGLDSLGVATEFHKQQSNFRERYAHAASVPCFTASARHELEIDGKKLVGSAQRRFGDVLLQHGSIMLTPKHRDLPKYLASTNTDVRAQIEQELIEKTISISEILGRTPSYNELSNTLKLGFERAWNLSVEDISLRELESALGKISSTHFEQ